MFSRILLRVVVLMLGSANIAHATTMSREQMIENVNVAAIKAHLAFLAHDQLQGRDTGEPGHEIASLYIASQFQQIGLQPGADDGSFMQRIRFRKSQLEQTSPSLTLTHEGQEVALQYPSQYITRPSLTAEQAAVSGELIFVGYGITAPELEHDDYAGLDVQGKVVVLLSGKPKWFPSEEGAHFASGRLKSSYAAKRGAIGMISVSTPTMEKVYPYQKALNNLHSPAIGWLDEDNLPANTQPSIKNATYFSQEAAQILFQNAPTSLADIYAMLEEDKTPKGFPLNTTVDMRKASTFSEITSPNVVAVLPGSDPKLSKEYVVFTAHSDHIGVAKSVKKDRINNGAMDNASGTAVLLETARLFSMMPRPKRSIIFLAVTAEEKGLLGSDYYARNPTVPIQQIVANINLDMPVLLYDFKDIVAFGSAHSDLSETVAQALAKLDMTLSPDPWPEQAIFTRSDHYSFVKEGVPAVYIIPGLQGVEDGVDGGQIFGQFLGTNYHMPSDEFGPEFKDAAIRRFTQVNVLVGEAVANQINKPAWNEGDFFGNTFAKD